MADDPTKILVQPGRLVWGATNLSSAYPYGGAELGLTRDGVRLIVRQQSREIKTEETGIAPQEIIALGDDVRLEATLYQFDEVTLPKIFNNTSLGSVTGKYQINFPGSTVYPGYKLSGRGGVLVFSPTDTTNNYVILMRKAVPLVSVPLSLDFSVSRETALVVSFVALPDTTITLSSDKYSTRTAAIAKKTDLTI